MIPTCSTCRYFVPDDDPEIFEGEDGSEVHEIDDSGTCHRHAPQPTMYCFLPRPIIQGTPEDEEDGPDITTIWPAVDAEDFCGEFKMIDRKGKK